MKKNDRADRAVMGRILDILPLTTLNDVGLNTCSIFQTESEVRSSERGVERVI